MRGGYYDKTFLQHADLDKLVARLDQLQAMALDLRHADPQADVSIVIRFERVADDVQSLVSQIQSLDAQWRSHPLREVLDSLDLWKSGFISYEDFLLSVDDYLEWREQQKLLPSEVSWENCTMKKDVDMWVGSDGRTLVELNEDFDTAYVFESHNFLDGVTPPENEYARNAAELRELAAACLAAAAAIDRIALQ